MPDRPITSICISLLILAGTATQVAFARQGADPNVPSPPSENDTTDQDPTPRLPDAPTPDSESQAIRDRRLPVTEPQRSRSQQLPDITLVGRVLVDGQPPAGLIRVGDQYHMVREGTEFSSVTERSGEPIIITVKELTDGGVRLSITRDTTKDESQNIILQ